MADALEKKTGGTGESIQMLFRGIDKQQIGCTQFRSGRFKCYYAVPPAVHTLLFPRATSQKHTK